MTPMDSVGQLAPTGAVRRERPFGRFVSGRIERAQAFEVLERNDGAQILAVPGKDDSLAPDGDMGKHIGDSLAHDRYRDSAHLGQNLPATPIFARGIRRILYETLHFAGHFTHASADLASALPRSAFATHVHHHP
jgi:hypothetical protein